VSCYSDIVLSETLVLLLENHRAVFAPRSERRQFDRNLQSFWFNRKQAYINLGMMCVEEAKLRGIPYDRDEATCLARAKRGRHWQKPGWVGWKRLHSSHRAALLQIGEVERVILRFSKMRNLENKSILIQTSLAMRWLNREGFCYLDEGRQCDIDAIHDILDSENAPPLSGIRPNHYAQFSWIEQPCGELYAWPREP
jgi:hypothetical protein